ncbi:energy-coupled thiamine transporter ThiT [Anaerobranca gottschalkii]|uniref:Energy-coupled thiamine transporter ThiT n=1 Tax=Anaerobranca gottschalkii DSM 13577 TaxID=1120990 RepID=A0A1H9YY35_9FIRM|nr:energy-coupled thiamine transporter ThiT [Anaerobranca gottschalkii]SES74010.1 energy-coupled thiamine transporter ThiT [Anaerobranca gottschalkii DSM 13577]
MNRRQIKILVETSMMLALAFILSYFRIGQMPQGGSISLQMIPIFLIALRWGFKAGTIAGVAFGVLKIIGPGFWFAHPIQVILDYPLAFGVIGIAGLLRDNQLLGISIAGLLRFLAHFISGIVFFGQYAPEGQSVFIYSLIYNATYMVPEILLVIFITPYIVNKLHDIPHNKPKEERLVLLSLLMPLLMITAYTGRVDNAIVKAITEDKEVQVLLMNIFKGIVSLGWLGVLVINIIKFFKEKVKTPLFIFINSQVVVVLAYLIINKFLN